MPKLLVLAHGHPVLSPGGAEAAAYAIHSSVRKGLMPGWESVFLARARGPELGHDGELASFRGNADEMLAAPPGVDHLYMKSLAPSRLYAMLDQIVDAVRPDVVHAHHFVFWGIDIFSYFAGRKIPLIFTFHEYIAMCHRNGQMLKINGRLCYRSSPAECHQCFPDVASGIFFLRRQMFLDAMVHAHTLISPSEFLAERVRVWSGDRLAVKVLENPRDQSGYESSEVYARDRSRTPRIGFFGQINPFKGVHVLLRACRILKQRGVAVRLRLFGANLEIQEKEFREVIEKLLSEVDDMVEFFGPYRNESVIRLMRTCAAVVIPSVWWENSPVVIQEAREAGVPVVGSKIGGIEEKLRDYPHAYFAEPGSPHELADAIEEALEAAREAAPRAGAAFQHSSATDIGALRSIYESALGKEGQEA